MLGARESQFAQHHRLTKVQEVTKFFKFLACEVSAAAVQSGVFALLFTGFGLKAWSSSYLPALIASVLWSFTANRKFTFKSVSNIPIAMAKVTFYYLIFTPLSAWWGDALSAHPWAMGHQAQGYVILAGTLIVNFVTEFCVYRFWVYRRSINSSVSGQREQARLTPLSGTDLAVS